MKAGFSRSRASFCPPLCLAVVGLLSLAGCNGLPGKPTQASIVKRPTDILDPVVLYNQNCAGCHGADGKLGPAPPIGDPVYLAIVDDDALRNTISKGRPGTAMSAFAQSEGGMLTTQQVDAIVKGIRQRWSQPQALEGMTAPPYAEEAAGNPQQGAAVFTTFCASCHGADGKGTSKVGSIVDPFYLTLITNQGLRTLTIVHRPDFVQGDWRTYVLGHAMSDQQISDVVAWLAAQRPAGVVTASPAAQASVPPAEAGSGKEGGRMDAGLKASSTADLKASSTAGLKAGGMGLNASSSASGSIPSSKATPSHGGQQ